MLSQANHHQAGTVWVKQSAAPQGATSFAHAKHGCDAAAQAPGSSPSSDASCAMEYASCSMPATPAAQEQQQFGHGPVSFEGWFARCRGCGCMTAHEKLIKDADVPFCRRCQHTLHTACPAMQQKMVDTLLYVHHAWSNAGL